MTECGRHNDIMAVSEKLEKSLSIDHVGSMETYHRLVQDGKAAARGGDLVQALQAFKLAFNIHQTPKLEGRIQKIQELISQDESEEDDDFVNINDSGLMVFRQLHDKLYDYQREGVAFLYSLYRDGRKGGILADDMGLGKTIQVISFLSGMYDSERVKHTLLVMPTSLITNWTREFSKWVPGMRVKEFHGFSKRERSRNLEKVQTRGGVVITTYAMLMNNWQQLASCRGKEFTWDYMILDEAHKIKTTSTKTAKSAYAVPAKNRVLLTGTPVQNNLQEMWALFDFACQGTLLGTAKTFKAEYENPITRARNKDATPGEKVLGSRMSENLMAIIKPYFFRRTKSEVQKNEMNRAQSDKENHLDYTEESGPVSDPVGVMPALTRKNDLIVWTYLSAIQEDIYRQFISLDHIKELLLTTKSPLAELTVLKKVCDHPRLLSAGAFTKLGLQDGPEADNANSSQSIAGVPDSTLITESGKMVFLFSLLEQLKAEGHRTLVFAHFRKVLDIIERILGNRGSKLLRLDGTITQLAERERRISLFQSDRTYSVFLLTTQVGGVGITLTGASRVVIYDPSWNPATDAQAVDRAYRIGQTEDVVIYRLITCGTVEEKIYRRQVFKDSLIRQNTGDKKNPFRYFSKQELKELFILEDPRTSTTQLLLQALHARHRHTDPGLDRHIAHLHTMDMFGISDHDLMFSVDVKHDRGPHNQEEKLYIEGRVQQAQELMKAESEQQLQLAQSKASEMVPAWLRLEGVAGEKAPDKIPKRPKQSPSLSEQDRSRSRGIISLDSDDSGGEDGQQNPPVVDLTADENATEEATANRERTQLEPSHWDLSQQDLVWLESMNGAHAPPDSPGDPDPVEEELLTQSPSSNQKLSRPQAISLHSKRLSILQSSNSFHADVSSRISAGFESYNSNFNLQLEDSDMMSSEDHEDHLETEAEETKLLSDLLQEGSFDVDRSLLENSHRGARHGSPQNTDASQGDASQADASQADDSQCDASFYSPITVVRKKRAAVIYDSEDEDEEQPLMKSHLEDSFQVLEASTPKSETPTNQTARRSVGGNTSVASHRSLLRSIMEDMEEEEEEEEELEVGGTRDDDDDDDVCSSSHRL